MNWHNRFQRLMNQATDGGQGGGAGTPASGGGSLLTVSDGKGGSAPAKGGAPAGDGAASGGAPAGAPPAGQAPQGSPSGDWRLALPKELQESGSIKKFTDVSALAGAYVNLEKLIGAEKIPVPSKHATEEDWQGVFKKLGLPEADKYEVKFKDGLSLDKDFVADFKKNAHAAGILPQQAQKLADWFTQINEGAEAKVLEQRKAQMETEIKKLQTEWGKDYDFNLSRARAVLKQHADEDTLKYLDASGLGSDVRLVKLLAKIGAAVYTEDNPPPDQGAVPAISPTQARTKVNAILGDKNHPYYDKMHPGHKSAVAEVKELFEVMNPGAKKES